MYRLQLIDLVLLCMKKYTATFHFLLISLITTNHGSLHFLSLFHISRGLSNNLQSFKPTLKLLLQNYYSDHYQCFSYSLINISIILIEYQSFCIIQSAKTFSFFLSLSLTFSLFFSLSLSLFPSHSISFSVYSLSFSLSLHCA